MSDTLSVIEKRGKFFVTKNGEPIVLPKNAEGATIITEFDTKTEAEMYMSILNNLKKKNRQ